MRKVILILAGIWFLGGAYKSLAEERKEELGEMVVTATRGEKEVTKAPGSVSVVTKADMEKRNIQTVDQALNTIPGIFNSRGKGLMDRMTVINLRGIPKENRTLILLDGIPLNDAYTGSVMWDGFRQEGMERIEVVKGPFSSLYGGYAMGGVVNIISGYGSSWDRGEAMDDLRKFYLSYGDKIKNKLSLFLGYGYKTTNGYPADFNVQSTKPTAGITGWSFPTTDSQGNIRYLIGDKGDNTWWDDDITIKAGYDFSKTSRINLSFFRTRYEFNYDEPHTYLRDATDNPVWNNFSFRFGRQGAECL
ncbi:MAG: iron complex outermembrane recepter protein [bacterium]|nr:MAG: iron complex outermembrane recepter protein [bacterium]